MSELIAIVECPKCQKETNFIFSGSGTKGECMECGHRLNPETTYAEVEGTVVSYNG